MALSETARRRQVVVEAHACAFLAGEVRRDNRRDDLDVIEDSIEFDEWFFEPMS